jgi:hypothetical protein
MNVHCSDPLSEFRAGMGSPCHDLPFPRVAAVGRAVTALVALEVVQRKDTNLA